jgi:hypothetical protein
MMALYQTDAQLHEPRQAGDQQLAPHPPRDVGLNHFIPAGASSARRLRTIFHTDRRAGAAGCP